MLHSTSEQERTRECTSEQERTRKCTNEQERMRGCSGRTRRGECEFFVLFYCEREEQEDECVGEQGQGMEINRLQIEGQEQGRQGLLLLRTG